MNVNSATGLVEGVAYYATDHCNDRPADVEPCLIVVHAISLPPGQFGGSDVIDFFQGNLHLASHPYYQQLAGVRVSAHCWIRRCGELVQFVPFHRRAWHAGVSRFAHRTNVNDFSIGVELEGTETASFTEAQYDQLNTLIAALKRAYPSLESAPIVGHSDVAPVRKTDPGLGFDWQKLASGYLLMLGLLGLGGCSSFSDTGGFDRVESISKKELGSFELNTKGELTPAMQQTIQNLLKSPLTIDSSVQIALLNSKSLQSQYANLGIAEADLVQAGRLRNPGFSIGKTTQGGEREYENFVLFDLLGLLTLNQRTAIAERQFERAKIAAARDTLQLANKVRQAWIQAVASHASARYYDQVISATEAGALLAKRMAEAGNISTLSYARQHSLYAEFSAQGQRSKQKATYYKEQLIRLIGLIDPNQVILPERLPNLPENTRPQQNSIQTAINQRLDLIMAREETEALAKSMGLTRATNWVNVLEVGYLNSTSNEAPTKEGYEIELRLPIFDWGDAKTAKAEQLYRQAMNRTADLAIKATSEVRERHDAYLNNYRIARHYRDEIVPIRQRINEENMLRYNGMLISVFEILADARSQIISVDAYLNALRDFWLSDINLTASLQGTSIFNSSVQMTTNITPDTSAGGGH